MTRVSSRFLAFLAAVCAVLALGSGTALAHNKQVSSSPADGEVLASSPNQWTVTFDKTVPLASASGEVVKSDGVRVSLPTPRHGDSDRTIVFDLPADLTGSVTARWRLVGTDGHVISSRIKFSVQATVTAPVTTPPPSTAPSTGAVESTTTSVSPSAPTTTVDFPNVGGNGLDDGRLAAPEPVRAALRLINYLSFIVLGGLFFAEWYLAVGSVRVRLGVRLARLSAWGILLTSATQTIVFIDDIRAPSGNLAGGFVDALGMTPGAMLITKTIIGALIVAMTTQTLRDGFVDSARSRLIVATGAMYLVTLSYGGHSRSQAAPWLGIPADIAHTGATAVWLGGLLAFLFVVIPWVDEERAVIGFDRFSYAAERAVAVLVGTGIIQSLRLHTNPFTIFTNSHGLLLLAKIGLVALMLRLAARNRRTLANSRRQETKQPERLKKMLVKASLMELALGSTVLVVTSVLVATTPT
jgi:copper transport protein